MKTPRKRTMPRLEVRDLGPIRRAFVELADLTVLVGPQASGKSIFLQTLKLALDHASIAWRLRQQGLDWYRDASTLLDLYFGEGMRMIWGRDTSVLWIANGKGNWLRPARLAYERDRDPRARAPRNPMVFYVPAHRALTLQNGWPRHFGDYSAGDPFVVREFSEMLRLLLEYTKPNSAVALRRGGLGETTRAMVQEGVFGDYELRLDRTSPQKRLVLQRGKQPPLPFMVWSAGQREFGPLSIGLNYLFPRIKGRPCDWVILEEPEMGLHPKAITAALLLVLELLQSGYRVCLSTHSPHILDLIWALRVFRENGAAPTQVLDLFGMKKNVGSKKLAAEVLRKSVHAYYFDRLQWDVVDISRLDPSSDRLPETSWGGLIEWSTRVSDVVADFIANS